LSENCPIFVRHLSHILKFVRNLFEICLSFSKFEALPESYLCFGFYFINQNLFEFFIMCKQAEISQKFVQTLLEICATLENSSKICPNLSETLKLVWNSETWLKIVYLFITNSRIYKKFVSLLQILESIWIYYSVLYKFVIFSSSPTLNLKLSIK
jgi:hypothetical protein